MKRGGVEPNMDLLHAISIPINLELFYSNCRLLEKIQAMMTMIQTMTRKSKKYIIPMGHF